MKILSTALLAAGLVALSACGGGDSAANNVVADDTLNVAPDDFGNDVLLGNETLGNDTGLDANLATDNALSNASTNAAGNSQ